MNRPRLVLLHGSNGSAGEMAPLVRRLGGYDLFVPDLLGHGGRPVPERLSFAAKVEDLAAQLDAAGIGASHFLGYSFGGYLALALALRDPERVLSLTGIAVKYLWDPESVRHVVHLTCPDRLSRPGNPRQAQLAEAHGEDRWRQVTLMNRAFFASFEEQGPPLTDEAVADLGVPALILSGDADPLVREAEARHLAEVLPNARLGLWPGSGHPLGNVPLVEVKYALTDFIRAVEEGRFAPGPPLSLKRRLVTGGLPSGEIDQRIRRPRSG